MADILISHELPAPCDKRKFRPSRPCSLARALISPSSLSLIVALLRPPTEIHIASLTWRLQILP
jgi:hypothetical protein